MLRDDYPTKFNNTEVLWALSWSETSNVVEQTFLTEAGTDKVALTRVDKLSISASYKCTDAWVAIFGEFSRMPSFTLTRYNPSLGEYEDRTVRMREFTYKLVPKSQDLTVTEGVWEVSFNLEEF